MTIKEMALLMAERANECCYRSDGWEEKLATDFEALMNKELETKP